MSIVAKFKYLGGYVSRFGNDAIDIDSRIEAAGKAFGALRTCVFSSTHINITAKKTVYESLILGILLYGGESWSNTEVMLDRLRVFHARCVRSMGRVSRKHTWQHHISTGELEQRLSLDTIATCTSSVGSCVGLGMWRAWTTLSGCLAACSQRGCRSPAHGVRHQ